MTISTIIPPKSLRVATLVATFLTFAIMVLGAAVRVYDAGLSCPDWPMCYGQWIPFPAPEGGYMAEGVSYTTGQVFLEWFHRLLASLLGFVMLYVLYLAWGMRHSYRHTWRILLVSMVVLLFQIKLGGLTVLVDNINWSVSLHLGNALIFYGLLIAAFMTMTRQSETKPLRVSPVYKILWRSTLVIVFVTVLIGAMVSTSHAGGVCGGLLDCHGHWLPADNYEALHMAHRFFALLVLLSAIALFVGRKLEDAALQKSARITFIFTLIQVALGVLTLYSFQHPLGYHALSVMHLGWATVLFTVVLAANIKMRLGVKDPNIKGVPLH